VSFFAASPLWIAKGIPCVIRASVACVNTLTGHTSNSGRPPRNADRAENRRTSTLSTQLRRFIRRHRRGVAATLAAVAVLATIQAVGGSATPIVAVAVAATELPAGHMLTTSDIRVQDYPVDLRPPGSYMNAEPIVGDVIVAPVSAGEPLTATRLLGKRPQAGRGKVAAPVRLADAGVAGLLAPGDVITIISANRDGSVRVLARNARVITRPIPPAGLSARSASLVLVAVSAQDATTLAAESVSQDLTAVLQ